MRAAPLADDALERAELARPIKETVTTGNGYYLVASRARATTNTQLVRRAFEERF